nr:hypothetical protein [Escherichia coli]
MKKVVTVCPYCASGCKINLVVDNGKIVRAEAAQGKTNQGTPEGSPENLVNHYHIGIPLL